MASLIQIKRGTAASWTAANTVLAAGEAGFETDTKKMKVGDGSTAWTSLGYTVTDGDITGVTAGTGLSGGGSSGAVSLAIDTATVVDKTTAQTLTNKTIVATNNTLTGVINNTLTTTTGDTIYASAANTPARLPIGSTGNVLTVAGGIPSWAAPAGGGKVLQVVSAKYSTDVTTSSVNTFVDTGLEATITPSAASSRIIILTVCKYINTNSADQNGIVAFQITRAGTVIFTPYQTGNLEGVGPMAREISTLSYIDSPNSTSSLTYKLRGLQKNYISSGGQGLTFQQGNADSSIILMEIGA